MKLKALIVSVVVSVAVLGTYFFISYSVRYSGNVLKINFSLDVLEMHPHRVSDLMSEQLAIHLHEGLFRLGVKGELLNGIAEKHSVSEDGLEYIITLRNSKWSNGEVVTAHDFVRSWKMGISDKLCPYSNRFVVIKGVTEFRSGSDWDVVGVKADGDNVLRVTLSEPIPFFLMLLACPNFYVVHTDFPNKPIYNGPFVLSSRKINNCMLLSKNINFWDAESVSLDRIEIGIVGDSQSNLSLFHKGNTDFVGGRFCSLDSDTTDELLNSCKHCLKYYPASVGFVSMNVNHPVLRSKKIRQAMSICLDRRHIVSAASKADDPAFFFVPVIMSNREGTGIVEDLYVAKKLLEEGLKELGVSLEEVSIQFLTTDNNAKMAQLLQWCWREKLGISVDIDVCDFKHMLSCLNSGYYHISMAGYSAGFEDSATFLGLFENEQSDGNFGRWNNHNYTKLFNDSFAMEPIKRRAALLKLEDILLDECPVIPIFFNASIVGVSPLLSDFWLLNNGMIDFSRCKLRKV